MSKRSRPGQNAKERERERERERVMVVEVSSARPSQRQGVGEMSEDGCGG